jgi:hypothetical protein
MSTNTENDGSDAPDDPFMMGWEAACARKPRVAPDAETATDWLDGYDSVPPLDE